MNVDELDSEVINPSLIDPVLIAGVERRVLGLEFLIVVALITWKGLILAAVMLALAIVIPLHLGVVRITRGEPRILDIVLRHLRWARYYPSHGTRRAAHPPVKPSIPGAK